jgi:hypothetical protein
MMLARIPELVQKPFLFPTAHNQALILAKVNGRISKYFTQCALSAPHSPNQFPIS